MARLVQLYLFLLAMLGTASAFPTYGSLAGLTERELDEIIPTLTARALQPPPGPLNDTRSKIVNDPAHPWIAPGEDDNRGPCPGLNTLANHGYLPRNGIAQPSQIVEAVQEAFNMENDLAIFVTYAAHLVDGNLITDLLSIGGKTSETGPSPPSPAIVGGLDTHAVFEGDASMTRSDAFFGDNHSFNETLFQELVSFSNKFGGGFYNVASAAELRFQRIQDSIATNPQFSFISPRYYTAYAESAFPIAFFIDGRDTSGNLDLDVARSFFQYGRMPDGFFKANFTTAIKTLNINSIFKAHPIEPGANNGTVNSYTLDPDSADFSDPCKLYTDFVTKIVRGLRGVPWFQERGNLGAIRAPANENDSVARSGGLEWTERISEVGGAVPLVVFMPFACGSACGGVAAPVYPGQGCSMRARERGPVARLSGDLDDEVDVGPGLFVSIEGVDLRGSTRENSEAAGARHEQGQRCSQQQGAVERTDANGQ